ncbi:HEAT repeat domain-containing protein [Actinomadura chibensis]|uniref:HEAT repeat domain-containing protein n=1 Tax=Actinomadura chibensis TaxID=392828 RepID=A0A5D0NWH0_9ACTN|nr:HEAT repeat domain-containing protein [Actinomadura chibensis]TYB49023.1 HEAT repeat domain-containing protein [Actinomadura chibensis]
MLEYTVQGKGAEDLGSLIVNETFDDLAERFRFGAPGATKLADFDGRGDAELLSAAADAATGLERERALWEYAHRHEGAAIDVLARHLATEPDAAVRWNLLWLLVKCDGRAAIPVLRQARSDAHPEVRDWAGLFLEELTGEESPLVYERMRYETDRTFDQTLPLQIAGYADVRVPDAGWIQARLSPQWFASLLGRVMACTNTDTFMTDLVIEKELLNYHEDGSNHYETFLFRGASYELSDTVCQHVYESNTMRPFYTSGKVKEGPAVLTPVALSRAAGTKRLRPSTVTSMLHTPGAETARGDALREQGVVRSVRGRFWGWAHVDLDRYQETGVVEPGTVQLVSTSDPVVGKKANTVIYGTFRGKLADQTGEGEYHVNTIPCHGTVNGELDLDLDGVADADPRASVA